MGFAKRQMMEELERPYSSVLDTYVCRDCITDPYLSSTLDTPSHDEHCTFCEKSPAFDISGLLETIAVGIAAHYNDPADELPYDGREGGYQGQVYDGWDLITDVVNEWTGDGDLLETVAGAFADSSWCERDYFGLSAYQGLSFGWKAFSEQIRERTRFLFFPEPDPDEHREYNSVEPGEVLDALGRLFKARAMFRTLAVNTVFVRAHVVDRGVQLAGATRLGSPPSNLATSPNRMSPAGISMFYAAFDRLTARAETYDESDPLPRDIAYAEFTTTKDLCLLDLAALPSIPSFFDVSRGSERELNIFLTEFERDFTRPVARDSRAHAEYSPTQVVTEYVRHRLRSLYDTAVDGIVYRSSRTNGEAVVIFAGPEACGPRPRLGLFDTDPFLILNCVNHVPL